MQTHYIRKIAISQNEGCVSPVLDFARQILIVEVDGNEVRRQESLCCAECSGGALPAFLNAQIIDTVICGAVSRPLWELVRLQGIEIIPYIRGNVTDVIEAFIAGKLLTGQFRMSGCWPGARRGLGKCMCRHRFGQEKGTK